MVGYIRTTGTEILASDDPRRQLIGFTALIGEYRWEIPMHAMMGTTSLDTSVLRTSAGRMALIHALAVQAREGVIPDASYVSPHEQFQRTWNANAAPLQLDIDTPEEEKPAEESGRTAFDRLLDDDNMEP